MGSSSFDSVMQAALRPNSPPAPMRSLQSVPLTLRATIDYALEANGSGFRLKLAKATGIACGLSSAAVDELAEGIEYFHHASLIFDDLPCMDDATERRGRRCVHRVAGESQAILAGLALVNRAYTMCWKVAAQYPEHSGSAARLVERCIGELGILDGQDRDLSFDPSLGAKEVKAIAAGKTGALLQLTLLLPAILSGSSFSELLKLSRVARCWGIAYQGLDDFNDMLLAGSETGKTPFRDLTLNRPNLVVAMGPVEAHLAVQDYLLRATSQIEQLVEIDEKWSVLSKFHSVMLGKESALSAALEVA